MKKFSLLTLAAAGLLLGACSEKDEVAGVKETTLDTNGSSYVGVAIQLPSATSNTTRANDDLNNGIADEFKVYGGYLLLFKGTDANTATFIGNYSLLKLKPGTNPGDDPTFEDFENDNQGATTNSNPQTAIMGDGKTNITSTGVVVAKIEDLTLLPAEDLYAYVVLNPNKSDQYIPTSGQSFKDWSENKWNVGNLSVAAENTLGGTLEGVIATTGMLMTNSPVSDTQGGSNDPTGANIISSYRLDKSKIAKTADAAKSAPAGCVFVERAAAKVTVEEGSSLGTSIGTGSNTIPFEIAGWQVINVEPQYFNVRQANVPEWLPYYSKFMSNGNTKYRFVTKYDFAPTIPEGASHTDDGVRYRTYFGFDPQYDQKATLNKTVAGNNWLELDGVSYVPENTFDVANQTWQNTTQVTLKVQFNNGNDLYTISGDPNYYLDNTIESAIAATVEKVYEVNKFKNDAVTEVVNSLKTSDGTKYYKATVGISVEIPTANKVASNNVQYTVSYDITAQESTDNTTWSNVATVPALSSDLAGDFDEAVETAQGKVVVALYDEGMSYYNVRIRHFGEAETPWDAVSQDDANNDTESPFKVQPGANVEQIYGYRSGQYAISSARFLGRYGVVRDNWYVLSIDQISKLGSAVPEDVSESTTPDDQIEQEYYISAHVHILPWVLRTQSVKF